MLGNDLMIVTGWNNGKHHTSGAGYGLKIPRKDRDQLFDPKWPSVFILFPDRDEPIELNIKKASFWNDKCRELISKKIGLWLIEQGHAPWPSGQPPKFNLIPTRDKHFELRPRYP